MSKSIGGVFHTDLTGDALKKNILQRLRISNDQARKIKHEIESLEKYLKRHFPISLKLF